MSLTIPAGVESVVMDEDGVDDVAISVEGGMFRLERMSNGSFWSCIYMPDGRTHVFWFYAKKSKLTVEHRVEVAL